MKFRRFTTAGVSVAIATCAIGFTQRERDEGWQGVQESQIRSEITTRLFSRHGT